jgi:hypothetical protein
VTAVSFATGLQVGGTATTDDQGHYTLTGIPAGTDVIIVATRTIGNQTVRMSAVVTDPSGGSVAGDVNAASTLAAETLAVNAGKGQNLTAGDLQPVLAQAQTAVETMTTLDLTVGGAVVPATIGLGVAPGSVPGFTPTVPGVTIPEGDPKAMVQVIRENAVAIDGSAVSEFQKESSDLTTNVFPSFNVLNTGLVNFWWPGEGLPGLTRIEPKEYATEAAANTALANSSWNLNQWASGTWTIRLNGGATQVVTLATNAVNWDFTITVTDARPGFEQKLTASYPRTFPTLGVNTAAMSISIKGLTATPITFVGTGNVTADTSSRPISATLTGDFASPKVSAHGTLTSAAFTDHPEAVKSFSYQGSLTTATSYTGSFAVDTVYRTGQGVSVSPSRIAFTGSYASPRGAAMDGRFELNISNAATRDPNTGDSPLTPILGTIAFDGFVTVPQRPKVALSLDLTRQSYSAWHTVVGFRHDTKTLNGTVDWNIDTRVAKVSLLNQERLAVDLTLCTGATRSASGTIKTNAGTTVATFGYEFPAKGGYYVLYTATGLWESLF